MIPFERVSPIDLLKIHHEFQMNPSVARVSLHLRSAGGVDLGSLGEAWVTGEGHGS